MFDFLFRRTRQRRANWTQVAGELGGTFHLATGFWRRYNERIEANISGIPIVLDMYVVSTGKTSHPYTRVRAPYARGPGPKMRVYRQGLLSAIGKAIGMQDLALGELAAFDAEFTVKADNEAVARALWSRHAMERMLSTFPRARIDSDATTITLVEGGRWEEPDRLRAGIALVAELACSDVFGADALRAIPDATIVQPAGQRPSAELAVPVRVAIRAEDRDGQLVSVARATDPIEHPPLVLEIAAGKPADPAQASSLPQGAHVPLHGVGTGTLAIDGDGIRFTWPGVERDPARLRSAAELIGAVAAGTAGTYR
ncbi:MAG TPA: hypothetical protein VIU61_21860 [Kofleriaceae bacterium]